MAGERREPGGFPRALRRAQEALRRGDRAAARRAARTAISIDPRREEAWLLLAAVSRPRAGLAYAARALEINPRSRTAREAIRWLVRKLPPGERKQALREASIPADLVPQVLPLTHLTRRRPFSLRVLASSMLLAVGIGFWIGDIPADALEPQQRSDPLAKATYTPTPTDTPTPTPSPTATPSPTPTSTATPTPTATATPPVSYLSVYHVAPEDLAKEGRWIDVDISEQRVTAYQGEVAVRSFVVSTGVAAYPTVLGQYRVYIKLTATDMAGPGYYLPGVPYTMYFYKGYALHGTYWHDNFGTPMSHGCVNLRTSDAKWLFEFASVGTLVNVHP